ncbi:MAG: cation diffusion facilitator family transporter [Bacteroidales bacterium]|nr:cation diffusion facilitator family transporter [Bacteroidales bacterium]
MNNVTEEEKNLRSKQITKTSIIGIVTNVFLSGFKAIVGLLSGSIAIILDAVNNLTDALSSVITILGVKLAHKKPDAKHPFGHGRVEYFSAIVISLIVLVTGATSLVESIKKISTPTLPEYGAPALIIICVAIVTKIMLGRFVKHQGEKYHSDALVASGADAMFDAIISVSTLIGALITLIWGVSIDGWLGAIIAIVIIKAGADMLAAPLSQMIGARPDSEITQELKKTVREIPGVMGAYDLILHNYGPDNAIGSIHVEISDKLSAREIHKLSKTIQKVVYDKFSVFITVGIYAVHEGDDEAAQLRQRIKEAMLAHEGVIGFHGLYVSDYQDTTEITDKYVSFDVVINFSVGDKDALHTALEQEVLSILPGYGVHINFDTDYSD